MGNSSSNPSFIIQVKTGDRKGAGTDATVWIKLHDTNHTKTSELKLSRFWKNDHERGQLENFPIAGSSVPAEFGELEKIELWRDDFGIGSSWYLDLITVEDLRDGRHYYFPAQRWILANTHYILRHYDTSLPQFDDHLEQRRSELEAKRLIYEYIVHAPGMPAQAKRLPEDECFSDSYKWDIVGNKLQFLKDSKLISLTSSGKEHWESFDDLKKVYKYSLGVPLGALPQRWNNDLWFGIQRIQGCNPVLISLCKRIPEKFALHVARTENIVGMGLEEALHRNRLFIIDLDILDDLLCKDNRTICAPIALFYLDSKNNLLPVAIQLFQKPDQNNPVFYQNDHPYAWLLAKMWYNNADASYHQSCTHLGFTHLLMEGVAICTHRNLSPSHPIFKLLAPHFLFLLAINTRGIQKLVNPGGWVDKTTTLGCVGMFELIRRGVEKWRLDMDAIPSKECARRGVNDPKKLPIYPYRDDAVAVYSAIETYIDEVPHSDLEAKIAGDYELQNWGSELVKAKTRGGCGIHGVPGNGCFTTKEQIITTMSAIICTCSVGHAAANFNQYDEYGFPPNYPAFLVGNVPTTKADFTEQDILSQLPSRSVTLDTMVITKLLSSKGTNSLGDFEVQYLYDPVSVEAAVAFRKELAIISQHIKDRNREACKQFPYPWLDPEIIPNSISI